MVGSEVEALAAGCAGPIQTTLPARSISLAGSPDEGPRSRLWLASTRSDTSPRVSAVVPLTKYQTGRPVMSYIVMIPGTVPLNPLKPPLDDAGMMLTSVQPAWAADVLLTVMVPVGRPAGNAPVVNIPVALAEPPASAEIALIR